MEEFVGVSCPDIYSSRLMAASPPEGRFMVTRHNNHLFCIVPQQQLYELLAHNKCLTNTHQYVTYVSLKQQFFCDITRMLLTYYASQRASAAPLHCLWPWALALASNEFMHIVSSAACVSVASFLRCWYLPYQMTVVGCLTVWIESLGLRQALQLIVCSSAVFLSLTWVQWVWDGVTWVQWVLDGVTWVQWVLDGVTWVQWVLDEVTWVQWVLDGVTWVQWVLDGVTWVQ